MIKQFDIWIANLNLQKGTEPGKVSPVLIVQSDFLNDINHPSTLICPISTNIIKESNLLRILLEKHNSKLKKDSVILLDQIRAIDNKRFVEKIGEYQMI